jgi:hypothetical protein
LICRTTIYPSLWHSYHKEEFMILSASDARQTTSRARYARCLIVSLTGTIASFGVTTNALGADPSGVPYFRPKPTAARSKLTEFPMSGVDHGKSSGKISDYYVTAPAISLAPVYPDKFDHIGSFLLENRDSSPIAMETGRTVTAAYPIRAVPGLDLTINMFAGHRQTNTGSNVGTSALTAGIRYKW